MYVLRYDMKENCQNTHHPSSLPCLIFPPFLCSWIRIEGFIFSPTVFVFPPCSSNRREGTSRKHTVRSQGNTLGKKFRLSSFCFCFFIRQSQIVKSQESMCLANWQMYLPWPVKRKKEWKWTGYERR